MSIEKQVKFIRALLEGMAERGDPRAQGFQIVTSKPGYVITWTSYEVERYGPDRLRALALLEQTAANWTDPDKAPVHGPVSIL